MTGRGLDILKLKLISFVGTVLLTVAWCGVIPQSLLWLKMLLGFLGASSLPVLALVLSEAMKHTRNITIYMLRLVLLAALCAFPYYVLYHEPGSAFRFSDYLSGPFTVFYCVGVLLIYDKLPYKWLKTGSIFLFIAVSVFLGVEYAPVSVIIAYFVHIYASEKDRKFRNFNILLFSIAIGLIGGVLLLFGNTKLYVLDLYTLVPLSGAALAIPLLNRYNGFDNPVEHKVLRGFLKFSFYVAYLILTGGLALLKYYVIAGNVT